MKPSRFLVGVALLCGTALAQPKQGPPALKIEVPDSDPKIAFEKYKLPNGLEVILAPDKSVPIVAVSVWYHVGSGYENYGKSGFAHLFEHMMFQGSKHVGEDKHFDILKKIGSTNVNGTTNSDRTNYFEEIPSNQIETAIWMESDRMGWLLDMLNKKSLDNQIEVVRNERRQRVDNVPYGKSNLALSEMMYPEGHPYRYQTIGRHEDLAAASVDDVKNFFKTWYVPANATLSISGDFEPAEAKKLVEKWFSKFPASTKPSVVSVPAPSMKSAERTVEDEFAKQRRIVFAWHTPANFAEGDAELDVAASALSREGPGRLYKALVYDRPLATSVGANQISSQFSSVFQITVNLRPEANIDEVKKIVAAEVARLGKEALGDKEIARVVTANEAGAIRGLESLLFRGERLQSYNHYLGDPDKLTYDLDRYRKTNAEKIRATVAKYLLPDRMATIITLPKGGK